MLFTDSTCRPERLTEVTACKLRRSDSVERYQDCGWHCATGYKEGRVQIMVHANSKAELDRALEGGDEARPAPLSLAAKRPRKYGASVEIHGSSLHFGQNERGAKRS